MSAGLRQKEACDRWFIVGLLLGGAAIAYGLWSLFSSSLDAADFATWFFGGLVVHDLLVVPASLLAARALKGLRLPTALGSAFMVSSLVVAVALPSVLGDQRAAANAGKLGQNYLANLLVTVALIIAAAGILTIGGHWLAKRRASEVSNTGAE